MALLQPEDPNQDSSNFQEISAEDKEHLLHDRYAHQPATTVGKAGMNGPVELSLEQQFSLRSFETQVKQMSREQAQHFLIKLYEQMMLRETAYKSLIKVEWGIESGPQF